MLGLLDVANAYQQLESSEAFQQLLLINTHRGLFKTKRMYFGVSSVPSIFQAVMDQILNDVHGVCCYIDDILISDENNDDCHQKLHQVFSRLRN